MKRYLLLILLILITFFLGLESFKSANNPFQIFAEKDYLLIRSESGKIWGYGNTNSSSAESLKQNISRYFSQEEITHFFSLKEDKEFLDKNIKLQRISTNLVYLNYKSQTFLFFTEEFGEHDRKKSVISTISLKADWYIMNKNIDLDFFPKPKHGIMYISERNPNKNMRKKFRENNTPIISTKESNGFSLELIDNKWKMLTRN